MAAMKFQHETELLEDITLPGFPPISGKFVSSEDEFVDSDDLSNNRRARAAAVQNPPLTDSNMAMAPVGSFKQEFRRRHMLHGWLHKLVYLLNLVALILQIQHAFP